MKTTKHFQILIEDPTALVTPKTLSTQTWALGRRTHDTILTMFKISVLSCTILFIMLYEKFLIYKTVDKIPVCNHTSTSRWAIFTFGNYYSTVCSLGCTTEWDLIIVQTIQMKAIEQYFSPSKIPLFLVHFIVAVLSRIDTWPWIKVGFI